MFKKFVGVAAVAMFATTAAQAGVVIKSSGPSAGKYPVGKKVDDNSTVTLQAGDSLTVVTDRGTRVLTGPGTKRVGARGESRRSTFATLTRQRSGARARTGAVRAGEKGVAVSNPNLWNLDVTAGGTQCLANANSLSVWRPNTETAATYQFASADSGRQIDVAFAEGVGEASLSGEDFPLASGQSYTVSASGGASPTNFDVVVLDEVPRSMSDMAGVLAANGCTRQLDLLAEKVMLSN